MAKNIILDDIINRTLNPGSEKTLLEPDEFEEMMELNDNAPKISLEEFEMMKNQEMSPEEVSFYEELSQQTGDEQEDDKAEIEREFFSNIIHDIDEIVQKKIASDLIEKINADLDSRRSWEDSIASTLKTMGVAQNIDKDHMSVMPFENASTVEYPILIRSAVQYVSRSVPEIIPNKPAKAIVIGETTPERESQMKRVEDAINYQLTYLDKGFYNDYRKGEFFKSICGSVFRKLYHDPMTTQNLSRLIKPQDFIIHYEQVDLESCNRYTHRMYLSGNEVKKMQHYGDWANVDIGSATYPYDRDEITREIDKMDGYDISRANADGEELFHTIYEVHCNLDIDGYEDLDKYGEPTGISLPYIVTLDKDSSKLLSVRRNWMPNDPHKMKQVWFVHYQFLPGTGFYGFGYAHLIGSLARASTALLRAILDGTALHLLKGGFKTADSKINGDQCISPGEWRDVETTSEDINKSFYPLEFSAPSPQVLQILQFMDKTAADIVQNTEVMLGSASNTGPVGTTLALIEQSQKIYTAIHQATHRSFGEELQILCKLNFQYFPEKFEFASKDGSSFAYREDFDDSIRIIPVSDPNIASFQQRQAIDQATLQMATQFPQFFKMDEVVRRIMTNLNVPALDEVMYTKEEIDQQMKMAEEQQANTPPPIDPLEAQMQLEQQKIEGEMARDELKYKNEKEIKILEQASNLEEYAVKELNEALKGVYQGAI